MPPRPLPPPPWVRVETGEPQDFTILTIQEDCFRHPRDGSIHPRTVIHCTDWVQVLALTPEDNAILVRQFRAALGDTTLELPGGMVDVDETPESAARRELEEETGFHAESLRSVGSVQPNPALQTNRLHTFVATGCTASGPQRMDAGEDLVVELYPRTALPELVGSGAIRHALVLAALYLIEKSGPA